MSEQKKSIFDEFTGKYQLSKTLRFELKPIGETIENMRDHFEYDPKIQTFLSDQKIEEAYQRLKPLIDKCHEEFITISLGLDKAKSIDFSHYLDAYREKKETKNTESKLRSQISELFIEAGKKWKETYPQFQWKKGSSDTSGADILASQDLLKLIRERNRNDQKVRDDIKCFVKDGKEGQSFFTYFVGFNQNRANYYTTKEEKATAVATRIVHENLPKFCDNLEVFCGRKEKYMNAFSVLKEAGKALVMKDHDTKTEKPLVPIKEELFSIKHFSECLSQTQIEAYNDAIANANFLVNLYNQTLGKEDKNQKLKSFKTLYKQIGCGDGKPPFFALSDYTKAEADKKRAEHPGQEFYSVEEVLRDVAKAGEVYFREGNGGEGEEIRTVPRLLNYLQEEKREDGFAGVYWSKVAMNTISNRYFANWHDLKDRLKDEKVFKKADKKSGEEVSIPQVIKLSKLFPVLDKVENWKDEGIFFRKNLTEEQDGNDSEKNKRRREIVQSANSPSSALLEMIFLDVEDTMRKFLEGSESVLAMGGYNTEENKEKIKQWLEYALSVTQILRYFHVRKNKIQGEQMDSGLSNALDAILFSPDAEWFGWYDSIRNFLTKKPQDDAKKNKLKLNFENSSLAGGWDVNKESDNSCVLLQDASERIYLAITSKDNGSAFEKEWVIGRGKKKETKKNRLYDLGAREAWKKMEYTFFPEASKMIPKCSTQLTRVKTHFQKSDETYTIPKGFKVTSGDRFLEDCQITREQFYLNNTFYLKSDISEVKSGNNLSSKQKEKYVKAFQKEYWELLLLREKPDLKKEEIFVEWKRFCQKPCSELSERERKYKDALVAWIDFCKYFLPKYPKTKLFRYEFKDSARYNSLDEFYREVDIASYRLDMESVKIDRGVLDEYVREGKVYLFEIRNQDSNANKRQGHRNNLHTIYWREVFGQSENRPKLNGEAEIFYRRALRDEEIVRVKNRQGKEVIKNYRFSREKFLFHVPITLNFCLNDKDVNMPARDVLRREENILFLGIDRGEKHLAYYSLVDADGVIHDQGTLNMPFVDKGGKPRLVLAEKKSVDKDGKEQTELKECRDYNELLEARAGNRDYSRKNWKTIDSIKELKEGYISQVVRKVVDIAIEKNAFIVLEDLNVGFKRGRQKIEKSVYQKLELALAKKLNFLVDKTAEIGEPRSVTHALQLTPPVNTFGDMDKRKQFGIMLYTRAGYTSQTDPLTGWRKTIYLKKGSEENIKKEILETFSEIAHDGKDYVFTYTEKIGKEKKKGKEWKLYSGKDGKSLDRFRGARGKDKHEWTVESIDIVQKLDKLFDGFDKSRSLRDQLVSGEQELKKIDEYTAWESLRYAIDVIQNIRNTGKDGDERNNDFLHSPVRDKRTDEHFDSRVYWDREQKGEKVGLPTSGDANGAYNIARKGLIMVEHIRRGYDDLYITDEEWSLWLRDKKLWEEWMPENLGKKKKRKKA